MQFFNDPEPPYGATMTFSIQVPPGAVDPTKLVPAKPVHIIEEFSKNEIAITLAFPGVYAGKAWQLYLRDASIRSATVSSQGGLSSQTCGWDQKGVPFCEVFTGHIDPSGLNTMSENAEDSLDQVVIDQMHKCHRTVNDPPFEGTQVYYQINIIGTTTFPSSTWAYRTAVLPKVDYVAGGVASDVTFKSTHGGSYHDPRSWADAPSAVCQMVDPPAGYRLDTADPQPSATENDDVYWDESSDQGVDHVLTFRHESAAFAANTGVVIAGFLLAVAAGFLPVAVIAFSDVAEIRRASPLGAPSVVDSRRGAQASHERAGKTSANPADRRRLTSAVVKTRRRRKRKR